MINITIIHACMNGVLSTIGVKKPVLTANQNDVHQLHT